MVAALTRLLAVASPSDRKGTLSVSQREFSHRRKEGGQAGQQPHTSVLLLKTGLMWLRHMYVSSTQEGQHQEPAGTQPLAESSLGQRLGLE